MRQREADISLVWFPNYMCGLMCASCAGRPVGRRVVVLQPELSERTSSLLPAFVQSTSYCWAIQLGSGGKQVGAGGLLWTYYLLWEEKRKERKVRWMDHRSLDPQQKCQVLVVLIWTSVSYRQPGREVSSKDRRKCYVWGRKTTWPSLRARDCFQVFGQIRWQLASSSDNNLIHTLGFFERTLALTLHIGSFHKWLIPV